MIGAELRGLVSIYEDFRNLGLVLMGAGALGWVGLGEPAESAGWAIGLGATAWLLSIVRPKITFTKEKE